MSLPDELQSLAALKAKGALTEQEFAQAKAAVIAKYGGTSTATPVATAAQHKQTFCPGRPGHCCPTCQRVIGQGGCKLNEEQPHYGYCDECWWTMYPT